MTEGSDRPKRGRRIDALRNEERIFAAAKRAFAATGASTKMEDIARAAGVGVGSLYRSFGNRAGLAEAIFREAVTELAQLADERGAEADAATALKIWLRTYVDELQAKRTMLGDLMPLFESNPEMLTSARADAVKALERVLLRAQAAGEARADVDADALMQLVNGLAPADGDRERAQLLLNIVIDGLAVPNKGPGAAGAL